MDTNIASWFEIYVSDMQRAKYFYEFVFAIKLDSIPADGMEYLVFPYRKGTEGACGALIKQDGAKPGSGGTLIYLACQDCALEESRVIPGGGKILKSKFAIEGYGYVALVKDTEGNIIGLYSEC